MEEFENLSSEEEISDVESSSGTEDLENSEIDSSENITLNREDLENLSDVINEILEEDSEEDLEEDLEEDSEEILSDCITSEQGERILSLLESIYEKQTEEVVETDFFHKPISEYNTSECLSLVLIGCVLLCFFVGILKKGLPRIWK